MYYQTSRNAEWSCVGFDWSEARVGVGQVGNGKRQPTVATYRVSLSSIEWPRVTYSKSKARQDKTRLWATATELADKCIQMNAQRGGDRRSLKEA